MWGLRFLGLAIVLFVLGWGLVLVSGYDPELGDDYNAAAQIGGVMVYASVPVLLIATACGMAAGVRRMARRRPHR